jgi:outer membrane protein assembly factor BamC
MNLLSYKLAIRTLAVLSACAVISSCETIQKVPGMGKVVGDEGIFRDHKADYLKAQTIPRTVVPAGKDSFVIDDLLVIPDLPAGGKQQPFLDPPMPRAIEGKSDREVVIQRMEKNAWIIVDVSPSQLWPRLRDYWRKNNVVIAVENPNVGTMETGWFVLAGNVTTQEKFKVVVEPGFQDNSSEIHLLQIEAPQATPVIKPVPFPAQSMNADTEYTVLTSLSGFLADVADLYQASSVSFLAGTISGNGKATIATTPGGSEVLQLKANYDRCWAAMGRALKRAGVTVQAEDAAEGYFDLAFDPAKAVANGKQEKPGFFHKVWTLGGLIGSGDKQQSYNLRLKLLKTNGTVEAIVSPTGGVKDASTQEAGNTLLELLRNTIA